MPLVDPQARREYGRQYKELNKERIAANQRRWFASHPGYLRDWKRNNRDKVKAYKKAIPGYNRLQKLGIGIRAARLLIEKKTICVLCGDVPKQFHLDHIVPLSRGGSSRPENLQWLCDVCNSAKAALTVEEFLAHIRKVLARAGG